MSGGEAFEKLVKGDSLIATVNGVGAGDVDISDTVRVSARSVSLFDVFHGRGARGQDDASGYQGRLRMTPTTASASESPARTARRTWLKGLALPRNLASDTALRGESSR